MNIPYLLTDTAQWILWKQEIRDGKSTKVPCDAYGRPAAVNDPKSWYQYHEASQIAAETNLSGIGFCFTAADPFVGIDLDDCLPTLRADALEILRRFPTYAEISPSGMGIKLIGLGDKGDILKARTSEVLGFKQMEVYDRDRFFTVTGNQFGVFTEVEDVQESLDWLLDRYLTPEAGELSVPFSLALPPAPEGSLRAAARGFQGTDAQALECMYHFNHDGSLQALYERGEHDLGDASRADARLLEAIAWIVGPDSERIERIFNASELGKRPKWQRREDYRTRSIQFVIDNQQDHYKGGPLGSSQPREIAPEITDDEPPVHLVDLKSVEAQRVTWWFENQVPKGIAVMCASAGGVVKGLLIMHIAAHHIDGPVLYLGAEDNLSMIIKPRAIAAGVDLDRFIPLREVYLDDGTRVPIRFPIHAAHLEWAIKATGAQMVVIDAGPEHMQSDLESNKVESVRRFMTPLNDIAERLNVTIFLILHTNKTQGAQGTDRISGNRAWVDAQRHVLLAAIDDEDDNVRHVQVGKTNIAKQGVGWKYRIEVTMVKVRDRDTGEWVEEETPYLVYEGASDKDVNELMNVKGKGPKNEAKIDRAILEFLKEGKLHSDDVDSGVSELEGVAKRTVRNHRMELNKRKMIRAFPAHEDADGRVKKWYSEITWEGREYLDNLDIAGDADW